VLARLYAGWLLGLSLIKTLVLMVLVPGRRGLRRFEDNYREDRLLALLPAEQSAQTSMSTCIACGRCDGDAQGGSAAREAGFRGLMGFMLSASRSMPEFPAAASMVSHLDDAWLQRMEDRCPSGIPFRRVVGLVRGYDRRLRERS
jgi:hypothetical protein